MEMRIRFLFLALFLVQCGNFIQGHTEGGEKRDVICNYVQDDRGYVCEVEGLKLSSLEESLRFTGKQLPGKSNEDVVYFVVKNSETAVVPSESILYYMQNLKFFVMKGVSVTKLDPIAYCLPLELIDLSENQIKRIEPGVFIECENLEILNLSKNVLRRIHDNAFSSLKSLLQIDLSSNSLDKLYRKILKPLKNVKKLFLNNNKIADLPHDIFNDLFHLEELSLSNNPLNRLDFRLFDYTIHLETLHLVNANLVKFHQFTFKNLRRLRFLDLSDNNLFHLGGLILSTNSELVELRLNNCRLKELGRNFFDKLNKLETLQALKNVCVDGIFHGDSVAIRPKFLSCFENLDARMEKMKDAENAHSGDEL